jgi:formiminotetrahydrofolate cyclodeaminase
MTSIDIMIVVCLINLFTIVLVISRYKKRKKELERRLSLIEHHVLRLEKKLRKNIDDANEATFIISKGLIELFCESGKNNSGDLDA